MGQTTTADTIEVEHDGRTVEVPDPFERADYATHFGGVPDEWLPDRIYVLDGAVRAEAHLGAGEWITATLHTDESHPIRSATTDRGWIARTIDGGMPSPAEPDPGETLWRRD